MSPAQSEIQSGGQGGKDGEIPITVEEVASEDLRNESISPGPESEVSIRVCKDPLIPSFDI